MKHSVALSALWFTSALAAPFSNLFPEGFIGLQKGTEQVEELTASATSTAASAISNATHQSGGDQYIVLFNASHPVPPEIEEVLSRLALSTNHSDVHHIYNNSAFRGFSANLQDHCVEALTSMVDVSHVEKSTRISSVGVSTRTDATWGLQRISSDGAIEGDEMGINFTYSWEYTSLGAGVDIYVVDTGVNVDHIVFGGRARNGWTAFPSGGPDNGGWTDSSGDFTDGAGHGTHVSGTAAGAVFGVAPSANIIAVRVLDADGGGTSNSTIAGIDWVVQQHEKRKSDADFVGSVLSMSFGTDTIVSTLTEAIKAAVGAGIHASVAAGNEGEDACSYSPSDAGGDQGGAVVVGAIGSDDTISSFSNTGSCTDLFAPGENVLSSYIGSNNTIQYLSGTSMACPHVTGVMAYLMAQNTALGQDPAAMKMLLTGSALGNLVDGTVLNDAQKILLNNGVTGAILKRSAVLPRDEQADAKPFDFVFSDGDSKTWW